METNPWENQQESEFSFNPVPVAPRKTATVWDIHYRRILSVWPWMFPAGLLFLAATWIYLRYQDDIFQISASIVMQDQSQNPQNIYSTKDPINDNIARLKSPTLMKRVVDTMGLQFSAMVEGQFKDKDLYDYVKWRVLETKEGDQSKLTFSVKKEPNGFQWKTGNQTGRSDWGVPFEINGKKVVLSKIDENIPNEFICYESDPWSEAFAWSGSLTVGSSKINNVVELSLMDIQRKRAVDVLNTLIQIYNGSLLSDKRKSQEQAVKFIQGRLDILTDQLDSIERVLADFKAQKGLILEGGYLGKIMAIDDQLNEFNLQHKILRTSEDFIKNPETKQSQLSVTGVTDAGIQNAINTILVLIREREKLALSVTESNPKLQQLDKEISDIRNNLDVQISNYKKVLQVTEEAAINNLNIAKGKFMLTPWEEKRLNEILRLQKSKLDLYLTVLQRKEDASVQLASISVETFTIRPAMIPRAPIGPHRKSMMLTAFFIGIWVPFAIALILEFLNNRIISRNQLEQMLTPPVLAELDLEESSTEILHVKRKDRSIFGEQIRSLRAGLRYYARENQPFYILITSSMSGEGKSFISANLAASFSLQGKRVALLEFDLRRPKLSKRFGCSDAAGISTILIGKHKPAEVPFRVNEDGHLDLFPAGPVPPNPSELMSSDMMTSFKEYLDENYDVIVIDTPPNGIVADAQLLQPWVNITLVLTRFRLTVREQVREIEEWHNAGIFKPMAVIFNGVSIHGYYGNKYSYYYTKRKYGYKYYSSKESLPKG